MALDERYRWVIKGAEDSVGRERDLGIGLDTGLHDGEGRVIMDTRGWVAMEPELVDELSYRLQILAETLRQLRQGRRTEHKVTLAGTVGQPTVSCWCVIGVDHTDE